MATGGVSPSSDLWNCSICYEVFKEPKLLPCFHTFCATCLEKYIDKTARGNTFNCPMCRTNIQIPKTGVAGFQANFYIGNTSKDEKKEGTPCDGCSNKRSADHRCLDCEENFCSQCTEVHLNMKMSRHHKLMELKAADESMKRKIKSRVFCNRHTNKEVEVICKDCDKLLCVLCMLTEHKGHTSREITEEANEVRRDLESATEGLSTKKAIAEQDILAAELDAQNREIKQMLQIEKAKVQRQGERIHDVVDEIVKKTEEKLEKEFTDALKKNDEERRNCEVTRNSLRSLTSTAAHILMHENNVDVICKGRGISIQISKEREMCGSRGEVLLNSRTICLFQDGPVSVDELQKMVGTVTSPKTRPTTCFHPQMTSVTLIQNKLKQVSCFDVRKYGNSINDFSAVGRGCCWISFYNSTNILLVDTHGKLVLSADVGRRSCCITSDDQDNCIVACRHDHSIKRVTRNGDVEDIITNIDCAPYSVAYRKTQDGLEELIFTGINDIGCVYKAPYTKNGKTSVLSSGYMNPTYVAVDKATRIVCVAGCEYWSTGPNFGDNRAWFVQTLNVSGTKLSRYDLNQPNVCGACFDNEGCIIITGQARTQKPHRIMADGTLVQILNFELGPKADIDSNNRIWSNRSDNEVIVLQIL